MNSKHEKIDPVANKTIIIDGAHEWLSAMLAAIATGSVTSQRLEYLTALKDALDAEYEAGAERGLQQRWQQRVLIVLAAGQALLDDLTEPHHDGDHIREQFLEAAMEYQDWADDEGLPQLAIPEYL